MIEKEDEKTIVLNKILLSDKLKKLGRYLHEIGGMNMMEIINSKLENYKKPLSKDEIDDFDVGISILKKTNYPNIDSILLNRYPFGISSERNLKIDGKWSFLNKLNTNYTDLSDLIIYLIEKMIDDKNDTIKQCGMSLYQHIIEDNHLDLYSKRTHNIISRAIQIYIFDNGNGLDDLLMFTKNSEFNTSIGNLSEKLAIDLLKQNAFDVLFQGKNGDYIDMVFGTDIIVYDTSGKYGYKTVQVKTGDFNVYSRFKQYKSKGVNWGITVNRGDIKIYDLQDDYRQINISPLCIKPEPIHEKLDTTEDTINSKIDISLIENNIKIDDKLLRIKKCNRIELFKNGNYYIRGVDNLDNLKDDGVEQVGFILSRNNTNKLYVFNSPKSIIINNDRFNAGQRVIQISNSFLDFELNL